MKAGRPSIFTTEIANRICAGLADGLSLRAVCEPDDMPSESTVRSWVVDDIGGISAQYARSRDIALDRLADEVLEIADTPELGVKAKTNAAGETEVTEGDMIEHRRLRVDARKWYLAKLAPKKYGERMDVNHSGSIDLATRLAAARERTKDGDAQE